jgi:HSP20 family protein
MKNSSNNSSLDALYGVSVSERSKKEEWESHAEEGQLSVDVFDTEKDLIVVSTLAGASEEDIEIVIHSDLLTIRGFRTSPVQSLSPFSKVREYFHNECFWGKFSRTIVLPHEVKSDLTLATLQKGVLVITLPKKEQNTHISITLVDD